MTEIVGGLGERLLIDSLRYMLNASLDALGWFDAGRRHRSVTVIAEPVNWDVPVEANLIALYVQDVRSVEGEMGTVMLTSDRQSMRLTLLAESEALGLHLAGDLQDILGGNMPDAGRTRSSFEILDFQQATPPVVGYALIDDVAIVEPPSHVKRDWLSHWYDIDFVVTHDYGSA